MQNNNKRVSIEEIKTMYAANPNLDVKALGRKFVERGYIVEGLNDSLPKATEVKAPESPFILDFGKGLVKSFVQPVATGANLLSKGEDIVQNKAIDLVGALKGATPEDIQAYKEAINLAETQKAKQESAQAIQEKAKVQNDAQQVGKVAGDITQFVALPTAKGGLLARGVQNAVTGTALSGLQGGDTTENLTSGGLNALLPEISTGISALKTLKKTKQAQAILDLVSPRLTPSVAAEAKVTNPQGVLGTIREVVPQRVKDVAGAVQNIVNPSKSFTENKNLVEKAIGEEAGNLKSALSTIKYDGESLKKILKKSVNNVEIPELIKTGEKTVKNQARAITNKLKSIIDETISNTDANLSQGLKARQIFDEYVQKEFPKAFDDVANARNILIKNSRTALNQTLDTLAQNKTVSKSLKLQNLMYDALDTISEKVAKGELRKAGEIGSNKITRLMGKNPKTSKVAKYVGATVGGAAIGGGAYSALKDITGN